MGLFKPSRREIGSPRCRQMAIARIFEKFIQISPISFGFAPGEKGLNMGKGIPYLNLDMYG